MSLMNWWLFVKLKANLMKLNIKLILSMVKSFRAYKTFKNKVKYDQQGSILVL